MNTSNPNLRLNSRARTQSLNAHRTNKRVRITQVKRIISGAPANICMVATTAPRNSARPPVFHPRSTNRTTQGIQPRAAILLGHIRQLSVRPLKAKAMPATDAPMRLPVHHRARQYIPNPAQNWWARQNILSDQESGSSK